MSFEREFNRTKIDAERIHRQKLMDALKNEGLNQIRGSLIHLEISLNKLLENVTTEDIQENKQHIDNIYYHIGAIRGCL